MNAVCDGTSLFDPGADANNSLGSGVGQTVTYDTAPQMAYNQTDYFVGFPSGFSLLGPNDHTHIDADDAWSLTVGGRVRIPFGSPS